MQQHSNLSRPVPPGRIAVRKIGGHWIAFSTTRIPGWPSYLPGLYYNRMVHPYRRTLAITGDMARQWGKGNATLLKQSAEIDASASALAETCS